MTAAPFHLGDDALRAKAGQVRRSTLAIHARAPETRVASSLSCVEFVTALYYGGILAHDPAEPFHPGRDRFVVSKGHGSLCLYPVLADRGFFPLDALDTVCRPGSFLGGIPDPVIPGYETVNGSLGHGAGTGTGMALSLRMAGSDRTVFVLLGDGELYEGSNWEAFAFAAARNLTRLVFCIDANGAAMLDFTRNIVPQNLPRQLAGFGLETSEVDGHDVLAVRDALRAAKERREGPPAAIILRTVKGKGAPRLEEAGMSHVMALRPDEIDALTGEAT